LNRLVGSLAEKETNPTGYPNDVSDIWETDDIDDGDAANEDAKAARLTC
jgi:hypothetical protein